MADNSPSIVSSPNCLLPPDPVQVPLERLHTSDTLCPGESFELPLLLLTHQPNQFELSALLVFRQDASSSVFYSCLVEHMIDVEPVINVLVGLRPQHGKGASYLISLEIENVGGGSDIQVSDIVAVLGLDCRREWSYFRSKIDDVLQGKPIEKERPPPLDLRVSTLQKGAVNPLNAIVQATRRQRLHQSLSAQFPLIPIGDRLHIFPLFTPSDLELVICWSTTADQPRTGYSVISGLALRSGSSILKDVVMRAELGLDSTGKAKKTRSMYAKTTGERDSALVSSVRNSTWNHDEDPLVVEITAPERTEHNFIKPPALPILFNIRNTSSLQSVNVSLSFTPQSDLDRSYGSALPLCVIVCLGWFQQSACNSPYIGVLPHRGIIPPSSSKAIKAKAWIVRPGVYFIEGWSLSSRRTSSSPSDHSDVSPTAAPAESLSQVPDESNRKTVVVVERSVSRRDVVWGVAWTIDPQYAVEVKAYLDHREKEGYNEESIDVWDVVEEERTVVPK
ncbi:hypothetical protein FRB90_006642, partial [Tulasnella sp. 427]